MSNNKNIVRGQRKNALSAKSVNSRNTKVNNNLKQRLSRKVVPFNEQIKIVQESVPVSYSNKISVKKPRMGSDGSLNISHSELLSDVVTESSYKGNYIVFKGSINPGLSRIFPWLANMAKNFQEYRFSKISLRYAANCATSISGTIMMSAVYDPSLPVPNSEQNFSNLEGMVATNVWKNLNFSADKSGMNSQKHYYIRGNNPNTTITNEDIKLLDCCYILVGLDNCPSGVNNLGKVYIDYTVTLSKPYTNSGLQQIIQTNSWILQSTSPTSSTIFIATTASANSLPYGKFSSGNWSGYVGTYVWFGLQGVGTKLIKTSILGTVVTEGLLLQLYQYTATSSDDGNVGFTEVIEDMTELMTLADVNSVANSGGTPASFTALTTSANIITGNPLANSAATQGSLTYIVNIPDGCVLRFNGAICCSTLTTATIAVTDFDYSVPSLAGINFLYG